jgi:hypothetical protein
LVLSITACLQLGQPLRGLVGVALLEVGQALELATASRPRSNAPARSRWRPDALRIEEGIDADDRVGAVVLLVLVVERLFLDLAALVAGFHGAEHAAAGAMASNSLSTASSTRSVSSSMMKAPWLGFSFLARPHSRLMISWMAMARRTDSSVGVVIASS